MTAANHAAAGVQVERAEVGDWAFRQLVFFVATRIRLENFGFAVGSEDGITGKELLHRIKIFLKLRLTQIAGCAALDVLFTRAASAANAAGATAATGAATATTTALTARATTTAAASR